MDKKPISNPSDKSGRDKGSAASIDDEIQNHLGRQLQSIYDDVLHQPVPERFMNLLRELDEAAKKNADSVAAGAQATEQGIQNPAAPIQGGPLPDRSR